MLAPGGSAFCQIALSEPLLALRGDRFIIRDETAQRTLGGGRVIHPWPQAHRRGEPGLEARLKTLQTADSAALVECFLDERDEFASPIAPLYQFLNLRAEETIARLREAVGHHGCVTRWGRSLHDPAEMDSLREALVAAVRELHDAHPLAAGRDMEELRDRLPVRVAPKLFRAFVERLEMEHAIAREGSLLRLPEHRVSLRHEEQQAAEQIARRLGGRPLAPCDLPQIARDTGIDRATLIQVMRVLERERSVVRVAPDLYCLSDSLERLKRIVREELSEGKEITPAMCRDRFEITRKYAIPLLEYLDREGVTVRIGDTRHVKPSRSAVS